MLIRAVAVALSLLTTNQAPREPPPPEEPTLPVDPKTGQPVGAVPMNQEVVKCKSKCGQDEAACMTPCTQMPGAQDPKNQKKLMACVMKCVETAKPCIDGCDKLDKKKKK